MNRFTSGLSVCLLLAFASFPLAPVVAAEDNGDGTAVEVDLSDLQAAEKVLERKIDQLTGEFKSTSEAARPGVRRALRDVLAKQFDLHQQMRERELAAVEERVAKLRGSLEERSGARDDLIDRRLTKLVGSNGESSSQPAAAPIAGKSKKPAAETAAKPKKPEKAEKKPAERVASSGKPAAKPAKKKRPVGDEPVTVEVDWSTSETITLASPGEWKIAVEPLADAWPAKLKSAPLPPKSSFFEAQRGLAVSRVAKKVAAGFLLGEPKPSGTTRVVIGDLTTGKSSKVASVPTQMAPIALHDDGETIIMRREEFGFGNLDRLEVWTIEGGQAARQQIWTPYNDVQGGARDVMWVEFIDDSQLATSSRNGKVVIWKFPELEPICSFSLCDGAGPALSPDRKYIAYCTGSDIGLFDVEKKEVVAQQAVPGTLQWPSLAFSPSGRRLACIAFDKLLVWDVATGELQQTIPANGLNINGYPEFPDDSCVLCGSHILLDIDNRLKWWTYDGFEQVKCVAGMTFFGITEGEQKPGSIMAVKIPHPAATDLLNKALKDPDLFVLHAGTTVKINATGISDPVQRGLVELALNKRLETIGCKSGANGTIELVATVEGPKDREVSFHFAGDYKVKEWISRLKFVYDGKSAWENSATNVPFFVSLQKGENLEGHLRSREKPDYDFFSRIELPKFLQKPSGNAAGGSLTIGKSSVTTGGIK